MLLIVLTDFYIILIRKNINAPAILQMRYICIVFRARKSQCFALVTKAQASGVKGVKKHANFLMTH